MTIFPRSAVLLIGLVSAALVLAGCSSAPAAPTTPTPSTGPVTPRTMPAGKGSGAADGVFPRTVVHFAGTTVVPAAPQRVAVISTGQADALLTLGVVPVASTAGDGAAVIPSYLAAAFPDRAAALGGVVDLGNRFAPNLETLAGVHPDLILMNTAGKDATALYGKLAAIAPTVATQGTGLYWKQDLLLLADALGRTGTAQRWLDTYHADAAGLGPRVAAGTTISFLRRNGDRMRVFGVASFTGSVAEDAGLARPESQAFTDRTSDDISAEQLDRADGDRLFYAVQGGDVAALTAVPLWPTLTAVAQGHAVAVDDDVFFLNVGPVAARGVLDQLRRTLAP